VRLVKTGLKVLGGLIALAVLIGVGFYVHLAATWKKSFADYPRPALAARADSTVIARGDYLVHAVAHCSMCHQEMDASVSMAEAMEHRQSGVGRDLSGGLTWDIPLFGRFVAANLTSDRETGVGAMSDGDLARVVRHSVRRDGTVAPFMKIATGPMADEDVVAVISYLRTLKPVRHVNRAEAPGIMGKLVLKNMSPREDQPPPLPATAGPSVERGAYLANGPGACFSCHSEHDPMHGFALVGPRFQGSAHPEPDPTDSGYEFVIPNLTPDPETGHIVRWDEDTFVRRFQGGPIYQGSEMPWDNFAMLTEDDVRSIYRYLRTLPPVKHDVGPSRRPVHWKPGRPAD
jgi:mono/diheme cytochrome c family protein